MARILLAEADDAMRSFLAKALERAGHAVVPCADGDDALAACEGAAEGAFELLLTAIILPGLDGLELARRCAEHDRALKIMFMTGMAGVALTAGGAAPADARVLSKPFHLRQLVDEVNRVAARLLESR